MNIEFVCRGNTFRSRLAEAYARSKYSDHHFSSSGVEAEQALNGHITWYAQWIAKQNHIDGLLSPTWKQTDWDKLLTADLVVCMDTSIAMIVRSHIGKPQNIRILDISDINVVTTANAFDSELAILAQTKSIFQNIRDCVDEIL